MASGLAGFETTFANPFTIRGIGVHSGADVTAVFNPADAGTGIIFQRTGPNGEVTELKAVSATVGNTDLCTVLGTHPARSVATVEHVMAALYALGIDNAIIEIDAGEAPVMDGSSAMFIDAIEQAGIRTLSKKRRYIRVLKQVRIDVGSSWAEFHPHDGTRFEVDIDFPSPTIGKQSWKGDLTAASFKSELSRARTFGFMRDVERLWAAGLALGSSLENSVVIGDDHRVINVEGLRYPDEFVRHKTLDAVGDLALAGAPFLGLYRSYRGGHKVNAMALKALLSDASAYDIVESAGQRPRVAAPEMIAVNRQEYAPWTA
ncbi:UDP-3-O-acyl-N-acetylglucosamine deacetylase [Rhizobium sp. TRM95796]|uniref:UDP-3-O-acyl-N-acetylglucosamine deacetylase n=1 Tax=Rhizobium sp. TRM95796 TaxID=2979862 RepID=UPI0021E70988|nr:UDP-3-O-acyl-N-acetylglucosamine deacetylase [Rhizobium sp. TRM95796]MCV3764599.1 UDP-3-O-acyl-N-acetylglucosamine deacetylase [Rhizobium sp. TRM95796]